jgi:hypothetical protein|eukprot:COSAG03_NODE_305_length_9164_cov_3.264093_4_plen_267_part_00
MMTDATLLADLDGFEYRPAAASTEDAAGVPAVVVLLGWTGSSPGVLRKYAAVWNDIGCQTLAACPGVAQLWRPAMVSDQVVSLCAALTTQSAPLVVHVFSGAASMYLHHIARCCASGRLRVAGLVFDSSPVDYTRESGLSAVREMALARFLQPLVAAAGVAVEWWSGADKRRQLAQSISHATLQAPALYLYCEEGDDVAPYASVERWATEHAARGNPVVRQCWPESKHVSHLQLHETDYRETIGEFLSVHVMARHGTPIQFQTAKL